MVVDGVEFVPKPKPVVEGVDGAAAAPLLEPPNEKELPPAGEPKVKDIFTLSKLILTKFTLVSKSDDFFNM